MNCNARTIARNGKYAVTRQDRKELGKLLAPMAKNKKPTNAELCGILFYQGCPPSRTTRWQS